MQNNKYNLASNNQMITCNDYPIADYKVRKENRKFSYIGISKITTT
uniref:Uncharacterized protein n=1 Tax=Arundo donax TaxID=35708 RepID=A0A0A9BTD4_ARUDO